MPCVTTTPIARFSDASHKTKRGSYLYYPLFDSDAKVLFLCFLEDDVLTELGAVFLELNLASDQLLILARPIGLACRFVAYYDK